MPHFADPGVGDGPGALGAHQPGLLAPHEDPGDSPRRPFRARARRPASRRAVLQLQRHGGHLAPRRDRRRRRMAARHADRGSGPQLPRAAPRLALRVRPRRDRAGGSARRDERVQVAAAPLGEGIDPDLPEAAPVVARGADSAGRQGRGILPPHRQLQLPVDGACSRCSCSRPWSSATTWAGTRCCSSTSRCSSRPPSRSATSTWCASARFTRTGGRA